LSRGSPARPAHHGQAGTEGPVLGAAVDAAAVLVWRFAAPLRCVSSAVLGGGLGARHWAVNAQVPDDYGRVDPAAHLEEIGAALGLTGPGVGMLTAADVRRWHSASDGTVRVDATVGLTRPTWAASDEEAGDDAPVPGTINLVVRVPAPLSDAALVNALSTAAEAKAQALWDAGVAATGTASDAICVACPAGGPASAFGGPRSTWGSRLARAVHRAVLQGCRGGPG